jgi:hypothetical protein
METKEIQQNTETKDVKDQEKKEKKKKKDKLKNELQTDTSEPAELPARILKRIEKRKRKKLELRVRQKLVKFEKIDYDKLNDEQIALKYQRIYPDKTAEELKNYVYLQRLVLDSKNKAKRSKK